MRSGGWRLEAPAWGSRRCPRACVANPLSRVCSAPFSAPTPSGPAHTAPTAGCRLLPPASASLRFLSPSSSRWRARETPGRRPEPSLRGELEERPDPGRTRALAPPLPAAPATGRCPAQPSPARARVGSAGDFWGPGEQEQVWRVLQPRLPPTHTRPLPWVGGEDLEEISVPSVPLSRVSVERRVGRRMFPQ